MSNALQKTEPGEVISAEQGKLIDRAKVYLKAEAVTEQHQRMYLFLIGATLHTLKDCTPHGSFEEAKKKFFPDEQTSRLGRAMQFADAVQFFAKGKFPTIGNLATGDRLLTAGELSEKEKAELVAEMAKTDKGGVVRTIQEWNKKKTPKAKEPKDAQHAHAEHEKNIKAVWSHAEAGLSGLLALKDVDFVLASPAQRQALSALCVRVNKRVAELKKS